MMTISAHACVSISGEFGEHSQSSWVDLKILDKDLELTAITLHFEEPAYARRFAEAVNAAAPVNITVASRFSDYPPEVADEARSD